MRSKYVSYALFSVLALGGCDEQKTKEIKDGVVALEITKAWGGIEREYNKRPDAGQGSISLGNPRKNNERCRDGIYFDVSVPLSGKSGHACYISDEKIEIELN